MFFFLHTDIHLAFHDLQKQIMLCLVDIVFKQEYCTWICIHGLPSGMGQGCRWCSLEQVKAIKSEKSLSVVSGHSPPLSSSLVLCVGRMTKRRFPYPTASSSYRISHIKRFSPIWHWVHFISYNHGGHFQSCIFYHVKGQDPLVVPHCY